MQSRYLHLVSLEEARDLLFRSSSPLRGTACIPIEESAGWVTSVPVFTKFRVPLTDVAAMDGYAVHADDTIGASDRKPILIRDIHRINTGGVVPGGYDAIVVAEDCWVENNGISIRKPVYPGQNIRHSGEDVKEDQMILPAGHCIRPPEVGALASYGVREVTVRTCSVGIIPTGGEIIEPGTVPSAGQVIDGNTRMATAWIDVKGVSSTRYPICPDDSDVITETVRNAAAAHDLVIVSAGSSTGSRDFTAAIVAELGELLFHGVAIRPGKPVLAGRIGNATIIGLPGYPLSAQVVLREFVAPLLRHWQLHVPPGAAMRAVLTKTVPSEPGILEFIPVTIAMTGGRVVAVPQAAGVAGQMASIRSNGYIEIPPDVEGIEAGTEVPVHQTSDIVSIGQTFLLAGPVTPLTDLLISSFQGRDITLVPVRTDAGGALSAVAGGTCHAALISSAGQVISGKMPELLQITACRIPYGIAFRNGDMYPDCLAGQVATTDGVPAVRELFQGYFKRNGGPDTPAPGGRILFRDEEMAAGAVVSGMCSAGTISKPAAIRHGLAFVPVWEIPATVFALPGVDSRLDALREYLSSPAWTTRAVSAGYDCTRQDVSHTTGTPGHGTDWERSYPFTPIPDHHHA